MRDQNRDKTIRHEVIQRYCPRHGENVVMLRTFGEVTRLQCMNFDLCNCEKDTFCGGADSSENRAEG